VTTDPIIASLIPQRFGRVIEAIAKVLPPMPHYCPDATCTHPAQANQPDETLATAVFHALREAGLLDPYSVDYSPMLAALDRCRHGRHAKDRCLDCSTGWSTGNLFLEPGQRIGTTLYGEPIMVPEEQAHRSNPDRWVPGPGGRWL
jgi:hypothetical protein